MLSMQYGVKSSWRYFTLLITPLHPLKQFPGYHSFHFEVKFCHSVFFHFYNLAGSESVVTVLPFEGNFFKEHSPVIFKDGAFA